MGCLWKFNRELLVIRAAGPPPLPTRGFRVVADAGVDACLGVPSGVPWWWRQVGGVGAATTVRSLPRVKDEGPGHPCVCVCVCVWRRGLALTRGRLCRSSGVNGTLGGSMPNPLPKRPGPPAARRPWPRRFALAGRAAAIKPCSPGSTHHHIMARMWAQMTWIVLIDTDTVGYGLGYGVLRTRTPVDCLTRATGMATSDADICSDWSPSAEAAVATSPTTAGDLAARRQGASMRGLKGRSL